MAAQTVYPRARHFREKFLLRASACPLPYSSVGARSFGETLAATLRTRRAALDMCALACAHAIVFIISTTGRRSVNYNNDPDASHTDQKRSTTTRTLTRHRQAKNGTARQTQGVRGARTYYFSLRCPHSWASLPVPSALRHFRPPPEWSQQGCPCSALAPSLEPPKSQGQR